MFSFQPFMAARCTSFRWCAHKTRPKQQTVEEIECKMHMHSDSVCFWSKRNKLKAFGDAVTYLYLKISSFSVLLVFHVPCSMQYAIILSFFFFFTDKTVIAYCEDLMRHKMKQIVAIDFIKKRNVANKAKRSSPLIGGGGGGIIVWRYVFLKIIKWSFVTCLFVYKLDWFIRLRLHVRANKTSNKNECWNWNAISEICFVCAWYIAVVGTELRDKSISCHFGFRSLILLRSNHQMHNTQCTAVTARYAL